VERTRVLVHLVECAPPEGAPDPVEAYRIVRRELEAFSPKLAEKPEIVALTKIELGPHDSLLKNLRAESEREVCPISAVTGQGLRELLAAAARLVFAGEQ
jgi:GTP-binding protein